MKELGELGEEGERVRLVESSLSALDKRAIRRLYGCYDVDGLILKMVCEMPLKVIPLILKRLREKEEEWIKEKCVLEEVAMEREFHSSRGGSYNRRTMSSRWMFRVIRSSHRTRRTLTRRPLLRQFEFEFEFELRCRRSPPSKW